MAPRRLAAPPAPGVPAGAPPLAKLRRARHLGRTMDVTQTLGLMAALLVFGVFCGWRGALPPNFKRGPRMMPWRPLMAASAVGLMMLMAYLSALLKAN